MQVIACLRKTAIIITAFLASFVVELTAAVAQSSAFPNFIKLEEGGLDKSQSFTLGVNKSAVIELPRAAGDVLVSNPAVADAILRTSTRLYLIGVEIGQASVFLFDPAGEEIASLNIRVEGDLTGLQTILNKAVPKGQILVEAINGSIILSGSVPSSLDAKKAEDVARTALETDTNIFGNFVERGNIVNLLSVSGSDQVTLRVTIAEIRREVVRSLGINTSAFFNGDSVAFNLFNPASSLVNAVNLVDSQVGASFRGGSGSLDATLRALEEANVMRMLAEPNLTAVSGERASFLAGGEFPGIRGIDPGTPSTTRTITSIAPDGTRTVETETEPAEGDTVDYEFLRVGVSLDFRPVVLSGGRISLEVQTEVSDFVLDGSVRTSGAFGDGYSFPPIAMRRASTTVELPSGGSFMIGGLVKETTRRAASGLPGLQNLPILGTLFSSRDFQRSETELVIIVTPYIVSPVSPSKLASPIDNLAMTEDAEGIFMGRLTQVYGGAAGRPPEGRYYGPHGFSFQ